jgi:hypothetical protein
MTRESRPAAELLQRQGGLPGRLSVKALEYAAALPPLSSELLSDRLYRYATLPRTSLAGVRREQIRLTARRGWRTLGSDAWPWISLTRRRGARGTWKLYLSPSPSQLYECVRRALPILTTSGAVALKIGRVDGTILRPDRFLAYFTDYPALNAAAAELRAGLSEFEGVGVPFTSPIGNGRLVSWGLDLSSGRKITMSWRQWVTTELGNALFQHSRSRARRSDPVEFALAHVASRGLDLSRFCPGPSLQSGLTTREAVR